MIAFIGVRISWDILDKKELLASFAASALCKASLRAEFSPSSSAIRLSASVMFFISLLFPII